MPTACSIPAVVSAKSDLASWVHNSSGYSTMSLYHKLEGAAGEKTSGKVQGEAALMKHNTDPLIVYALTLNRASSGKTHFTGEASSKCLASNGL